MNSESAGAMTRAIRPLHVVTSILVALAAGAIGGLAGAPGVWYAALDKPPWNPPSWVFGPVWTTLYLMMGIAAALAWPGRSTRAGRAGFQLFGLQLALNSLWSWTFFHWHRPDLALINLIVLWVTILGTIIAFRRVRPLAGLLLVPYLIWVSFAGVLNASIARRNPGGVPVEPVGPASGVAVADCAPWDGAATSIYLSSAPAAERLPPTAPYLQLIVYESGDRLHGLRVTLGAQEAGSGLAIRCQPGGECAASHGGTIEFSSSDTAGILAGAYRLTFADGPVAGSFRVLRSHRTALCG